MIAKSRPPSEFPPMPDIDSLDEVDVMRNIGETLFGKHWRRYLPAGLGVSDSYVVAIAGMERPADGSPRRLPKRMKQRLIAYCESEPPRVIEMAQRHVQTLIKSGVSLRNRSGNND